MVRIDSLGSISFRKIPHQSGLFLDYLDLAPKALNFYARPPMLESLEHARLEIGNFPFPRREIAAILRRQNEAYGSGPRAMTHIDELEQPDCFAVVTGQQVGLFTGPLYTIYKALTAIRIAEELRHRGLRVLPIFWMDSEDHDLAEASQVSILEADSSPRVIDYRKMLFNNGTNDETARPVGAIPFPESIVRVLNDYLAVLADSSHKRGVESQLKSAYRPGVTYSESFAQTMAQLFRAYGLVFFDPQDPEAKWLVARVFQKAIREASTIYTDLAERNRALVESGYHTQVNVLENSTVLFFHIDGERKALTRLDDTFAIKNSDASFTAEELLLEAESAPERFSPNVLLRPIIQDHLFPTVAYVGGPSEIAYFAQVHVLYQIFGRPMPTIWPRASFTFLGDEAYQGLKHFGIDFEDCLQGKHHVVEKVITGANHSSTTTVLKDLQAYLDRALEEVRPALVAADASLGPALETAKRKIVHHVDGLQTKFVHLEARHDRSLLEKADFLLNNCYPGKNLQERELGVHYFLSRHGLSLLDAIYSNISVHSFSHQVCKIDD